MKIIIVKKQQLIKLTQTGTVLAMLLLTPTTNGRVDQKLRRIKWDIVKMDIGTQGLNGPSERVMAFPGAPCSSAFSLADFYSDNRPITAR